MKDEIKKEIETERNLERLAKRCSNFFTKKVKRALFEKVANLVWNGGEREVSSWCRRNKVFHEITEEEIQEIWSRETPDDEPVRLNGK